MTNEDIKTVRLIINSEQAAKKLDEINSKLETARQKKQEALEKMDAKGIEVYSKEIRKLEREQQKMQTRAEGITKVLRNLDKATPKELRQTIKEINKELNSGAVERGSEEWNALTRSLREANGELKRINEETKAASGVKSWKEQFTDFGTKWMGVVTTVSKAASAFTGVKQAMDKSVSAYANMQEAQSDVRKYTGLTTEEVAELNEEFKKMDTRTSRESLNALAADAGRLGIQGKEGVMEFVEAANVINVALGKELGDDAVKKIGKLAQLFGDSDRMGLRGAMLATASTINDLGQSSSASEAYIVDFTGRLAGAGSQAGMTQAQIMGLASVLDQSMINAEEGSTALSKIIQKIYSEPQKMAQAAGLDVQAFTDLVGRDANAALLQFAQAVSQMGGMEKIAPMLGDMHMTGAGVSKTLMALAGQIDLVRQTQEQATQSFAAATSVQNEYNVANNTVLAKLEKAKKKFNDLRIELGEKLLPVQTALAGSASLFIKSLIAIIDFTTQYGKAIAITTASILLYTVALKANVLWTGLCSTATKVAIAGIYAWDYVVKAVQVSMLGFRAVIGLVHVAFIAMTKGTKAAAVAMRALNIALKTNPFVLAASVIASIGVAIYAWTTRTKEQTEEQKAQNRALAECGEVERKASASIAEARMRVESLSRIVRDSNRTLAERKTALEQLRSIVPGYHGELSKEGELINDNTEAITAYITALEKKALHEALYEKLKAAYAKKAENEMALGQWQEWLGNTERLLKQDEFKSETGLRSHFLGPGMTKVEEYEANNKRVWALGEQNRKQKMIAEFEVKLAGNDEEIAVIRNFMTGKGINPDDMIIKQSTNGGGGGGGGGNGTNTAPKTDPVAAALTRIKEQAEKERLLAKLEYDKGLIDRKEFEQRMLKADTDYHTNAAALYAEGTKERMEHELAMRETNDKQQRTWSLRQVEVEQQTETDAARQRYLDGTLSEKEYQDELTRIRLDGLKRRLEYERLYGTPEQQETAQKAYDDAVAGDLINRRKQTMQEIDNIEKQYLNKSNADRLAEELRLVDELAETAQWSEEEKEEIKKKIREKYKEGDTEKKGGIEGATLDPLTSSFLNVLNAFDQLEKKKQEGTATWEDYANVAVAAIGTVGAALNAASQLVQANAALEEARINQRYAAEIAAAGGNKKKIEKLEKQRDAELKKAKSESAKKSAKIQIAQAIAQGAMAAISAYSSAAAIPVIGFVMAPIAAAMAVAATAMQIATIKKQAQAQMAGYYSGGFTGGTNYHREAGVVHEGEFVANHLAVNNPNVAPVLSLIDHAQRTNRVASLTAADVSRAVAAPQIAAQAATTAAPIAVAESTETRRTLTRLSDALDAGIDARVVITGEDGFDRQWTRYQRLKERR